ncbi:hypothetical protein SASPL_134039 [Salvia splendens]|uniref:Uncharacterized protein n=1 Tax=Salvia splendens TaxID=180675 RepID=A0A8X8ZIN9_SALSN|nr:uncharacterized protein LOC121758836 [Salvia splendens]KAG6406437.1 hypothetical protein SASPL_134039 [Salvia splendens]
MESSTEMFDDVKFEKEKAVARFNRLRRMTRLRQIVEVASVFVAVSWCSARAPALDFATRLFNHHVIAFLVGNAIVVLLFVLCRHSDGGASAADLYDDFVRYSEAARAPPPPEQSEEVAEAEIGDGDCQKQIVVDECDDVTKVIEKAARQMKKFQRNRSEMTLRCEVVVRPELRRSETENRRNTVNTEAAEIENLSSEEFQRRVDAFIDKHWIKTTPKLERRSMA